jgi:hypothetical protein
MLWTFSTIFPPASADAEVKQMARQVSDNNKKVVAQQRERNKTESQ